MSARRVALAVVALLGCRRQHTPAPADAAASVDGADGWAARAPRAEDRPLSGKTLSFDAP